MASLIEVFPNPSSDIIKIVGNDIKEISLLNSLGQVDRNANKVEGTEINILQLPAGVHFVKVTTKNNKFVLKAFVKE